MPDLKTRYGYHLKVEEQNGDIRIDIDKIFAWLKMEESKELRKMLKDAEKKAEMYWEKYS